MSQKIKEYEIREFIGTQLKGVGLSTTQLVPTPLGEKIIINASRPGLVVGRKGQSIKKLTTVLKKRFSLENPQIEINEVENINLDPEIVAERIANSLERFGLSRFKGVGHKTMSDVMAAGALGIEIIISGKVPSSRAKRWRFYQGYLKKCGQIAIDGVRKAYKVAQIKTGTVGITVKIMPPDLVLPDKVTLVKEEIVEETVEDVEKTDENTSEEETKEEAPVAKKEPKKTKETKKPKATKAKPKVAKKASKSKKSKDEAKNEKGRDKAK